MAAFFVILMVWVFVLANETSFFALYNEMELKANLTIWGGILILSGWVGSLSEKLKKELRNSQILGQELDQKRQLLEDANEQLNKANRVLEAKVKERTEELMVALVDQKKAAVTDPLTGLLNRRGMTEQFHREILRYERYKKKFAVCMGDIDHFKKINDTHGHEAGDYILAEMAKIMLKISRPVDIVSRWGGEEFLAILPETDLEGGIVLVERIRSEIEKRNFNYNQKNIFVTLSFGVSVYENASPMENSIKIADDRLYRAKQTGRNKVVSSQKDSVR